MYLQCSHGFWGQYFSGWCFTHQYKNTTQFYFYAALLSSQNTKMPTGNKKIYFDGNIQTFGVRSGEHDLNNIYLDFLDENGTHCYIGFMTEGTKGVVFYSGGKLIWKITV